MEKISNYLLKGWKILNYLELWFLLKNTFIIKENTNYVHQHLLLSTYFVLKSDMSIFEKDVKLILHAKLILHSCIDIPLGLPDNFEPTHMILKYVRIFFNLWIVALNWSCIFTLKIFYFYYIISGTKWLMFKWWQ